MVATDAAWVASDIPGVADYLLKYLNMLDFKAEMGFFGAPKALMSRGTGIQFVQAALLWVSAAKSGRRILPLAGQSSLLTCY